MALGVAIGAITFTGSVIAAAKLNGNMSGKPIMLPQRHALNIGLAVLLVLCIAWLIGAESRAAFWLIVLVSFVLGVTLIIPIGRSEEHTSELQSHVNLVCRLLLEKKKNTRSC